MTVPVEPVFTLSMGILILLVPRFNTFTNYVKLKDGADTCYLELRQSAFRSKTL